MDLTAILAKARVADCPRCGSDPLEDCWPEFHLERVIHAMRYGWVTPDEFTYVTASLVAFQLETAFRLVPAGAS